MRLSEYFIFIFAIMLEVFVNAGPINLKQNQLAQVTKESLLEKMIEFIAEAYQKGLHVKPGRFNFFLDFW